MTTVLLNTVDHTSNPLVMLAALIVMGLERLLVLLATGLAATLVASFTGLAAVVRHWRLLAMAAGLVGVVVLCLVVPALPAGIGITAVVAWVTYPRA